MSFCRRIGLLGSFVMDDAPSAERVVTGVKHWGHIGLRFQTPIIKGQSAE